MCCNLSESLTHWSSASLNIRTLFRMRLIRIEVWKYFVFRSPCSNQLQCDFWNQWSYSWCSKVWYSEERSTSNCWIKAFGCLASSLARKRFFLINRFPNTSFCHHTILAQNNESPSSQHYLTNSLNVGWVNYSSATLKGYWMLRERPNPWRDTHTGWWSEWTRGKC